MAAGGFRVEVIRFGLLVTMTLALLTVAIRISSHPSAHHAGHVPAVVSPSTPSTTTIPTPTASPVTPTPTPARPRQTTTGGGGTGSGPSATKPVLPVTGWDAAARLTAAALALISAGGLSVAGSRRA